MEIYTLDEESWDWLMARLDEPARDMPKLKALMEKPSPFDQEV